ncbi:MAG: biliverdin-producing heme oxygenase [Pseudomonadota bacterium]
MGCAAPTDNLRHTLRGATASAHDLLDGTMRAASGWSNREDYARFLSLQFAARVPVEGWLARNAPDELNPPPQAPLIAQDLADLGSPVPAQEALFEFSTGADPAQSTAKRAEALGAAWVLAGSSLGNRAILAEVKRTAKQAQQSDWPSRFLGDTGMLAFWKKLRNELEDRADMEEVELATRAATAVFDHFIKHAQSSPDDSGGVPEPALTNGAP